MVNSKRVSAKGGLPAPLPLWWASADPHLHRRPFNTSRYFLFSFIWGSLFISSGSWCMQNFVYALQDWNLCLPHSSRSPIIKSAGPQDQTPYGLPVPLLGSKAGKPDVGFRTFRTVQALLWYHCSPFCGSPTWRVWDLILSWLHPSDHLTMAFCLSLGVRYLSLVGSSILLPMAVQ